MMRAKNPSELGNPSSPVNVLRGFSVQAPPKPDSVLVDPQTGMLRRPEGSVSAHFELVGFRDGIKAAFLLCVSNDAESFRDFIIEDHNQADWFGFDRFQLIEPGDKRPVEVLECKETHYDWFCSDACPGDLISDLVYQFDRQRAGAAA